MLTARRRDRLAGLAGELSAKHDIRTLVCVADLAKTSGPEEIFAFTEQKNIVVDLLVNNAGFGAYGEFQKVKVRTSGQKWCQVNVDAVGAKSPDASLPVRNDRARQRRHFDRCFDGGVSGGSLHHDVRGDKIV